MTVPYEKVTHDAATSCLAHDPFEEVSQFGEFVPPEFANKVPTGRSEDARGRKARRATITPTAGNRAEITSYVLVAVRHEAGLPFPG